MSSDKEIFISWLKEQEMPASELDHELAKKNNLKFNNHSPNADKKEFITERALSLAYNIIARSTR